MEYSGLKYIGSAEALGELMLSKDKDIVKISPEDYSLSNGVDYCFVGVRSNEGTNYLVQGYGKETRELYAEATRMVNNANTVI